MTPSLWLALLIVLIGAQAARVATSRRRVRYVVLLLMSAAGFVAAELSVNVVHHGGPTLGALHPVADGVGIGVAEALAIVVTAQRRRVP